MFVIDPTDDQEWHWTAITSEQIAAAASPDQPTSEMLGNFEDLLQLFDQLSEPVVAIELGKPLPEERYIPRPRVGTCPAAHNEALFG